MTIHARLTAALLAAVTAGAALAAVPGPARAAATTSGDAITLVQLGDSYSAGNGAGEYYGPADCYRSHRSWAAQYARWLSDQGQHVTLLTRACNNAVTADVTAPRHLDARVADATAVGASAGSAEAALDAARAADVCGTRYPGDEYFEYSVAWYVPHVSFAVTCDRWLAPQIDAVGPDTDAVMLTLGGNDLGFPLIVAQCFVPALRSPAGCRERVAQARAAEQRLQDDLVRVLGALRARMRPDATVVVVSYPYLSSRPSFVLRSLVDLVPFVGGDTYDVGAGIRQLGDEGDTVGRTAVQRANALGAGPEVVFVDTVKARFAGHEPDPSFTGENPDRWIHELDSPILFEWYHPTERGHLEASTLLHGLGVRGRTPGVAAAQGRARLDAQGLDGGAAGPGLHRAAPEAPYAWLDGPYAGVVGAPLTLDARGSFAASGSVTSYAWDFDGDGTTDLTTASPVVRHAWGGGFDGFMTLQVTDTSGRTGSVTTAVVVTDDGDPVPRDADVCPDVADAGQEDADGDGVGDACDPTPLPAPAGGGVIDEQ
ncbi:hypothetical protein Cch01nite_09510 [Cellulomonas chitinilytica]|uniref:PKD domain-containing protein n=1 Tax=Cellulomonas chitinilytica TaxID=398759 RepID=A0A919U172_9CELL|nr:GDSL-type esterase/lipase family protein [Cellulomonas chitinilytica]GIG20227.1 hypothetical protein Cch01nite_09510 [Cellulomonas chitinilytica]